MKKLTVLLLSLLLLAAMMATPVFATGNGAAAVTGTTVNAGETAYVSISLSGFEKADTIGIQFTPASGLKLDVDKSQWELDGTLDNVDIKNFAAWCEDSAVDVNTKVLTLAFTTSTPGSYNVSCKVTVKKGNVMLGEAEASGTVTVNKPATGMTLSASTLALDLKDKTSDTLTATVTPADTTDSVIWSSSDASVVSVADGKVTALKKGTATITAKAGSITKTCTVTVTCGHDLVTTAAVAPTCKAAGNNEYHTCKLCGLVLAADKKTETTVEKQTLAKLAHTTELRGKTEPTCSEAGYTGDTYCTACGDLIQKGETVPATEKHTPKAEYVTNEKQHWQLCGQCGAEVGKADHTFKWVEDKKATETMEGVKHEECVCGVKRSENTPIEKLEHKPVKVAGKAPTCTEGGVAEHFYCANCGGYYASADGKVGAGITKADTVLEATGHSFGEEWRSDEKGHWHECACGEISEAEAHEEEVIGAVEATGAEPGYTGDTVCGVCGKELAKGEEIPVSGTEAPEDVPVMAPTEAPEASEEAPEAKGSTLPWILIVLALIAAVAVLLIVRKRKK